MRRGGMIFAAVLVALTLSLSGCAKKHVKTVYETLDDLKDIRYSVVRLEVLTDHDGETLKGTYRAQTEGNALSVSYSYERFSLFGEEGGDFIIPDDRKTVYEGTMSVTDGEITSLEGDSLDLSLEMLSVGTLDFSEENFASVAEGSSVFSADVVRADGFFKSLAGAENMKVKVLYSVRALLSLEISYRAFGTDTVLTYRFEV